MSGLIRPSRVVPRLLKVMMPPEARFLYARSLELAATVRPEVWADRLKLIHHAKKEFHGKATAYRPPEPKAQLWSLLDTLASMDETVWTQEAVDRLKDEILDVFDAYPEADGWYRAWRVARPEARW